VSKVLVKDAGLNVFSTLVQDSKTYIESIEDTKDAINSDFFSCAALLCLHLPFTSSFFLKVLQNQNEIQSNQQISYQLDTNSLLNIL
jgi:hypothetical protein